jgi:hypothetical protein
MVPVDSNPAGAATPYNSFEPMVLELHYSREGIPLPETAVVRRVIPNPPFLLIPECPAPTHAAADKELEVA